MNRRSNAAQQAADQASQAARILQERGQQVKQEPRLEPEKQEPFQTNEQLNKVPRGNIHRAQMMEEIRQSRGEPEKEIESKKEAKDEKPEKPASIEEVHQEAKPEAATTESAKRDVVAPETLPVVEGSAAEAPKTVKVKIDGVEEEVPQATIDEYGGVKPYQLSKAAENRLSKAKEIADENRKTQAHLADIAKLLIQSTPKKDEPTDDQLILSKVDVIRFGTAEESAAALKEVLARTHQRIDPNEIMLRTMLAVQKQQAVVKFKNEFADIVGNPLLFRLAVSLEQEEMQKLGSVQGTIDFNEVYNRIGNQIRGAIPRQSQPKADPQKPNDNTSQLADKEARKTSIMEPLKAAAARAAPPAEEKPETREDSIKRMKKARGLPVD